MWWKSLNPNPSPKDAPLNREGKTMADLRPGEKEKGRTKNGKKGVMPPTDPSSH